MVRLSVVAALVIASGCVMAPQGPKAGAAVATGEQLNVVDDVKVWTTTYKEKVGETEYKDENGKVIGTGTVYQDRTAVHTMPIWYPVQGSQQIADEDFFRIAGDQQGLKATEDLREDGRTWHRRGIYATVGGFAAMIVGYIVPNYTARYALVLGGSFTALGGYYAMYKGAHEMNPETHAVDRSVAEHAAVQYNQGIGKTVGLGYTKKF